METGDLRFPVISNVEADVYPGKGRIKELLFQQVDHPVRWEESMQKMIAMGPEVVLEVGPGKVLSGLLRRISREVPPANVEDGVTWEKVKGLL
ncbi:MAG: hypothetical protein EHM27_16480 [Deltaproteobacteria bacterium]|nr:MAG: hypothetical protein EHM27_16480 [Deltaproteobacteria bacterium]